VDKTKRLLANLTFTFVARAAELLAGLLIIGMLTRYLGLDEFGRYSVLMAVCWVTLPFLNMGFPKIFVREIAQRKKKAPTYILIGWTWNILMTLVLFFILLSIHLGYEFEQIAALLLISLTGGIMAMTQTAGSLSIAFQYMHYETIPALISMTVLTVLIAVGIYFQQGLNVILSAYAAAYLIGLVLTVKLTNKLFPYLQKIKRITLSRNETKKLLKESLQIALFQILVQLHLYLSVFLLKAMAGNAAAALFQAPFRIFTRVQIIPMTCIPVLLPIFSKLFFAEKNEELRRTSETLFKSMLLICLLLTFYAASLADLFIPLILGSDFQASAQVFRVLSFSISFFFLNTMFNALFIASKKTALTVWIQSGGVFFCILINFVLIPVSGTIGSSWAIVISGGIIFLANCFFFRKLLPGIPVKTLLTVIISGAVGSLVALQTQEGALPLSLFLGTVVCLLSIFALRLVSGKDIKAIYTIVKQPPI
jgi:O-antigen/teichoic acid export membrane protein